MRKLAITTASRRETPKVIICNLFASRREQEPPVINPRLPPLRGGFRLVPTCRHIDALKPHLYPVGNKQADNREGAGRGPTKRTGSVGCQKPSQRQRFKSFAI